MLTVTRRWLLAGFMSFMALLSTAAWADGDTASDAPGGFADVIAKTRGVMIRVPVDRTGRENTNAAEMRFFQRDETVTKASDPTAVWRRSVDPGRSPEVAGTNMPRENDSSTWGWYNWSGLGWASPFYYSYYYPTFYYSPYWWSYTPYWNWTWGGYRYYYYWYWYWWY